MWRFLKGLFTEDDAGTTACPVRVSGGGAIFTGLSLSIFMAVKHNVFDVQAFSIGMAALIAALAAGIGTKSRLGGDVAEPSPSAPAKPKGK